MQAANHQQWQKHSDEWVKMTEASRRRKMRHHRRIKQKLAARENQTR